MATIVNFWLYQTMSLMIDVGIIYCSNFQIHVTQVVVEFLYLLVFLFVFVCLPDQTNEGRDLKFNTHTLLENIY